MNEAGRGGKRREEEGRGVLVLRGIRRISGEGCYKNGIERIGVL
jgi:hypothetical protein